MRILIDNFNEYQQHFYLKKIGSSIVIIRACFFQQILICWLRQNDPLKKCETSPPILSTEGMAHGYHRIFQELEQGSANDHQRPKSYFAASEGSLEMAEIQISGDDRRGI